MALLSRNMTTDSKRRNEVTIFNKDEFKRLKDKSKFLTRDQRMKIMEQIKTEQEKKATESTLRKKELQDLQKACELSDKLSEIEEDASRKANHLLARAFELRQEQEDEIKKCNALIFGTKCHAIRDAQIVEKELIKKELSEEERRLELMMEQERQNALKKQEKQKEKEFMKRQLYVKSILEQIKDNQLEKEIELERIEEERRLANEAALQLQIDELEAHYKKTAEQKQLRDEINKINIQLKDHAEMEKEQNRLADLKAQEYMRYKAETEAMKEKQLAEQKLAREKELVRLRAMQEKAADTQAARDEMNAIRIQDEVEREWRRKEKEAALKRLQQHEELKIAREKQIKDRRKCQAIENQREKEEIEKIIKINLEAEEREKSEKLQKICVADSYRASLLKQINEKEKTRIKARQELFSEGYSIKAEIQKREETLKQIMMNKVTQLRSQQVPEKYVAEVERQLNLAGHLKK